MDNAKLTSELRHSLSAISNPRFFETERGFQGELLSQLGKHSFLAKPGIIEQEYQKRLNDHGLNIRPDIIIHEPFDSSRHRNRTMGNIAIVELKLNASSREAAEDFHNIAEMLRILNYPIGFFINISSTITHFSLVPPEARGQIVSFAVSRTEGKTHVVEQHE